MRAVLGWCDCELEAPATCCIIQRENAASVHVAEKLGYCFERMIDFDGPVQLFTRARQGAPS
jgi:RimJ/RimL family protein N-acetyltransferase